MTGNLAPEPPEKPTTMTTTMMDATEAATGGAVKTLAPLDQLRVDVWAESATKWADHEKEHSLYTTDLMADVARPEEAFLEWPYPTLDALYGRRFPGEIVGVIGFSGHGKSTFALSYVEEQIWAGVPLMYLGTEVKPKHVKAHLIARLLRRFRLANIHPGDLLKGRLSDLDKKLVVACAQWFDHGGFWDTDAEERELGLLFPKRVIPHARMLRIGPFKQMDERITRASFEWCATNAVSEVVIDHVDQIESGSGGAGTRDASVRAMQMLHACAQKTEVCALYLSQTNNEGMKGPGSDPLRIHFPPTPEQVALGGHKRMISDGQLGIYRPLIPVPTKGGPDAVDAYKDRMKEARDSRDTSRVVMPWTMGFVVMKDRAYGRERQIGYLRLRPGSVLEEFPAHVLDAYEHGAYGWLDQYWADEMGGRHLPPPAAMPGATAAEVRDQVRAAAAHIPAPPVDAAAGDDDLYASPF